MSGTAIVLGTPLFIGGLALLRSDLAGARAAGVVLIGAALLLIREAVRRTDQGDQR